MIRSRLLCLVLSLHAPGVAAQSDWLALQWPSATGPRDVEILRSSVRIDGPMVALHLRRDRARALAQDSTIAPETNPWTSMTMRIDCVGRRWRQVSYEATNSDGKVVGAGSTGEDAWLMIAPQSLAEALRKRFCPSA